MSLATKYRPKTWDDVTEQRIVVNILQSICSKDVIDNHNFLFIGSAGIGKTSLARIVAREINNHVGEPIEIDAASNGSVESIRNIVEQARQFPLIGKYKVFIIDECHAISSAGWSAFLKCIEETPPRSIFIFCTTNPEKIPDTILSRVQVFQLSKISLDGINERLKYVVQKENECGAGIQYVDDALLYVSKLANGGMRDALTLLDKVLAYDTKITMTSVVCALNLPQYDTFFELLNAYVQKDNSKIVEIVDSVYNSGIDFVKWFEDWQSFIVNIVKFIYLQDINKTIIPSTYESKISKYTVKHAAVCLRLSNLLLKMIYELKNTQHLQEIALTYLCM